MKFFSFKKNRENELDPASEKNTSFSEKKENKKNWKKIILIILGLFVIAGAVFAFRTGYVLNKVSTGGNILSNLYNVLPIADNNLKGEEDGRINILLLGMRGEKVAGGGLLADTIMIASIKPGESKASLFSIPRDFYVDVPDLGYRGKINAVHHYGEQKGTNQGMEEMKKVIGSIVGEEMHYAMSINFAGFEQLVDSLGGIELNLKKEFVEPVQFLGVEQRCDDEVYTIPSGNFEEKRIRRENGTYYDNPKRYPLCFAKINPEALECGGVFKLPVGNIMLDGEQALCYVRSRATSSDFDRARRQQDVLQEIKAKALSAGTLTDFGKVNKILNALADNVRTDLQAWEMKKLFDIYQGMGEMQISRKVLENSEEGLLYVPENSPSGLGYILKPRGDNYDRIQEAFRNILNQQIGT